MATALRPRKMPHVMSFAVKITRRLFSHQASRKIEIEQFNKVILYGLPRIAYRIYPARDHGQKLAPIIIAHGMFGSKSNWNTLAQSMSRNTGRQVIAFDARNHGDSERHPSMSYSAMSHDLTHLMERLSVQRCILIGHSMGGKTVMSTALQNNDLVEKLIVVDSAPTVSISAEGARTCIEAMAALDLSKIKEKRNADVALSSDVKDLAVRQFLLTNLISTEHGYGWRINLRFFKMNISELIGFPDFAGMQYNGDTLFVGGADSDYITEKEVPTIHGLFPNSQIHHIENAGHWVHSDQPLKFIENVVSFINR